METQTRFDLSAAIEHWRQELAAQPNLALDDRRELETHLRDAITGFQQRGLNDEDSFWLARRRVGPPQQLGEEFVKADPAKVWRERVLWITAAWLTALLLDHVIYTMWKLLIPYIYVPSWFALVMHSFRFYIVLRSLVIAWILVLLAQGRLSRMWQFLFHSRFRFAFLALPAILVSFYAYPLRLALAPKQGQVWGAIDWPATLLNQLVPPLVLFALIVWFMPSQSRKSPKRV